MLKGGVKFFLNLGKFLRELLAHSVVQILDDSHQCLLCLYQIIMLSLQKDVPLGDFLVFFNRIDIDVTKLSNLILNRCNQLLNGCQILIIRIPQLCRRMRSKLVLFPEIIGLILSGFFQLLPLIVQTEYLFIQIVAVLGDFLLFVEKSTVVFRHLLFLCNVFPKLFFGLSIGIRGCRNRLLNLLNILLLFLNIFLGVLGIFQKLCFFRIQLFHFSVDSADVHLRKLHALCQTGFFQLNLGKSLVCFRFQLSLFFQNLLEILGFFLDLLLPLLCLDNLVRNLLLIQSNLGNPVLNLFLLAHETGKYFLALILLLLCPVHIHLCGIL